MPSSDTPNVVWHLVRNEHPRQFMPNKCQLKSKSHSFLSPQRIVDGEGKECKDLEEPGERREGSKQHTEGVEATAETGTPRHFASGDER